MADYGRIIAAGDEIDGSDLAADHEAGVTVLDLEDALDYIEPESGETIQVRIVADDDTEELVTIKVPETEDEDTVDEIDGFLFLDAPTVNAFPEGSRVLVHPETKRRIAQVRLDDSEEDSETIDAIVDAALYEKIPEGTDLDMAVELAYDGEAYYVTNILGEEPTMVIEAGEFIGGTFTGVTFTGGMFRTAESGKRIEMSGGEVDTLRLYPETGSSGLLRITDSGTLRVVSQSENIDLVAPAGEVIVFSSPLKIGILANEPGNALLIRNVTDDADIPTPPAGYAAIYYNSADNQVKAKGPGGTPRKLNEVNL